VGLAMSSLLAVSLYLELKLELQNPSITVQ